MPYLRDRAFILKKEPFREQDRRIVMYGREHGLLVAVARGSSHARSKQAGHLEPFTDIEVMVAHGRAFDKLAVATRVPGSSPRLRLGGLAVLGAFSDLVASLTRPGVSDARIFDLYRDVREAAALLPDTTTPERGRLLHAAASLKLLDLIGFAPSADRASGLAPGSVKALAFMRRAPIVDVLRLTVTTDVLEAACTFVDEAMRQTPLDRPPHGPTTIGALLGV
ncbi:recombination protein O N-terminal domain-containing protein [Candidatus Uhrbacteria bacterium]|nr:recombination protein O N-terminal domain-containing protein [Candidatus Uhrbacteria bacterium]